MPVTPRSGTLMRPSQFNLRVPLNDQGDVFLMNTLTDAQIVVSPDVAALLDRAAAGTLSGAARMTTEELEALDVLSENGFLVDGPDADRAALDTFLSDVKSDASEL